MDAPLAYWINLHPLLQSVLAIVCVAAGYYLIRVIVIARLQRLADVTDNDLDDRLIHFLQQFLWIAATFLALIWVLRIHDIKITPLLAGAGILGVAVGFAAKETLADILSGVFLIADRPVRVGDRVRIESIGRHWGSWGDVVDIGLRRTQVRNTDGVIVNYPNSVLANSIIKNFTFDHDPVRVRIRFQVAYDTDLDQAKKAAIAAIQSVDGVLKDSAEVVVRGIWDEIHGHTTAGVLVEGRYRIENIRARTRIRSKILERLLIELREHGVSLPAHPVKLIKESDGT